MTTDGLADRDGASRVHKVARLDSNDTDRAPPMNDRQGVDHRARAATLLGGLEQAHAALDGGDYALARDMALDVVDRARARGDDLGLARGSLFVAHCSRLVSRLREAHDASQLAVRLYQQHADREGEALALATQSYIAVSLGRTTQAVESAMLAALISERLERPDVLVFALNYLGFAYLWVHAFDLGVIAVERAVGIARELGGDDLHAFQPLVTKASLEATRVAMARTTGQDTPSLDALIEAIDGCEAVLRKHAAVATRMGMEPTMRALHRSFSAVTHCWQGDLALAERHVHEAAHWSSRYPETTWLDALQLWVRSELAVARSDLPRAEALLRRSIDIAASVEHETFGCMMRRVLIHNLELQGEVGSALDESRQLRQHEDRVRLASLDGRQDVVTWRLDLRDSRAKVQDLREQSASFERQAHEDVLTSLPNRRYFEFAVDDMLRRHGKSGRLWLLLLDVDRFKRFNDEHSHEVGDGVLRLVADALRSAVRQGDLVARWAGDEFVVALPDATHDDARHVAERIREAVAGAPVGDLAPGLTASVSIGMATARHGENLDSLVNRSDLSMLDAKRAGARAPRSRTNEGPLRG
jgi:diguanylate cyclase (GGDEF)-like protein